MLGHVKSGKSKSKNAEILKRCIVIYWGYCNVFSAFIGNFHVEIMKHSIHFLIPKYTGCLK